MLCNLHHYHDLHFCVVNDSDMLRFSVRSVQLLSVVRLRLYLLCDLHHCHVLHLCVVNDSEGRLYKQANTGDSQYYEVAYMNAEFFLTDSCNMRCSFCGAWNQNGVCKKLHIATINEFLDELHENGYRYLSLSGGEPFLYDELFDVIRYAAQRGF